MGDKSKIQWTDATWNPTVGCTPVSPGCLNCYAAKQAPRLAAMGQKEYVGLTVKRGGRQVFNGTVKCLPDRLDIPYGWKRPRMIFVDSMSDLFHESVPFTFIADVFTTMGQANQHIYQVLTKRPERMAEFFRWNYQEGVDAGQMTWAQASRDWLECWPNVWLGTSIENREQAEIRIPKLKECPAAVRFLSCEPLLEALDLREHIGYASYSGNIPGSCVDIDGCTHHRDDEKCRTCGWGYPNDPDYRGRVPGIGWIIVGGESGKDPRRFGTEWALSIVEQGAGAGVPVFVKQLGANPTTQDRPLALKHSKGGDIDEWPEPLRVRQMPMQAGRIIGGSESTSPTDSASSAASSRPRGGRGRATS